MGQAFADRARHLLREAETLRSFREEPHPVKQLRIAVQPGLPPAMFVFAARLLSESLPDVHTEMRICSADEALSDPDIDVVCQFDDTLPYGPHRTFINQRYPVRMLASPDYLDARGRPETVAELADHDLLAWTGYRTARAHSWPLLDGTTFPVAPSFACNDTHVVRTMANSGLGIALVADAEQARGVMFGEVLEPVLEDIVGEEGRARILVPERAAESPSVREFIRLLRFLGLDQHKLPPV
jgi:DNA-binding transcriptional LysR family regulator